jgi:hypothetical protein
MYPFQQEMEIRRQVENNEFENLEVLLSGKGIGKLVVNAPTAELLKTWIERLERVCQEPLLSKESSAGNDIIMAGTIDYLTFRNVWVKYKLQVRWKRLRGLRRVPFEVGEEGPLRS